MTTKVLGLEFKVTKVKSQLNLKKFRRFQLIKGGRLLLSLFKGRGMTRFALVNATQNSS
jgi:hypothetical protein